MSDQRFSRSRATAEKLGARPEDVDLFTTKRVLITGTRDVLATSNGEDIASTSLLLIMRFCANVTVVLPAGLGKLAERLRVLGKRHGWGEIPTMAEGDTDPAEFDAVLSVGGVATDDSRTTVVTSNGWLARVTSTGRSIAQECAQKNAIGAVGAASLAAGEIFKRLIGVKRPQGIYLDGTTFSLFSYESGGEDAGPALPEELSVDDLLVAGAGAIGNGVAYLIDLLSIRGTKRVLDYQTYAEGNWGTCICLEPGAAIHEAPKAAYLAELLAAEPVTRPIEEFIRGSVVIPSVVLSCFDNVDARHAVQDLWPDIIIDGALGPKMECQASVHPWESTCGCLRCCFERPPGEAALTVQQRLTGLHVETLADLTAPLTTADVERAAPENREWLSKHVGKPRCSVLEHARELNSDTDPGFRPSVPFVATMSASMMIAELLRRMMGYAPGVAPRFQFSFLWGPERGLHYEEDRHADCVCVLRKDNIETVRRRRKGAAEAISTVNLVGAA